MKKCLFCAEEIQDEAIKCKHCGEFLDKPRMPSPPQGESLKWYFRNQTLILGALCIGPLILPLVWFHPKFKMSTKILITLILLLVSQILGSLMLKAIATLKTYYGMIDSLGSGL